MPARYNVLHPDVYRLRDEHLAPEAAAALRGRPSDLAARAFDVAPGVFSLPLFTATFCAHLREELHRRERFAQATGRALQRPSSMNRDGVLLEAVGFEALLDELLDRVATPLGRGLVPHVGGDALDPHRGFTVE